MQCSHLVMKPVPVEQMIGQPESVAVGWWTLLNNNNSINYYYYFDLKMIERFKGDPYMWFSDSTGGLSPSLLSSSSGQSSSVSGQATSNPKPQPNKKISSKKADTVQSISSKCPECQTQFSTKEEVAHHFQEVKPAQTTVSLLTLSYPHSFRLFNRMEMNRNLIPFFDHSCFVFLSSPAQRVLLPCSYLTAAVQQRISAFTKAANHTSVLSVAPQLSSHCFKHTWTGPVCTSHAVLDTGLVYFHIAVLTKYNILVA